MKNCLLLFLCCTALSVWGTKPFELNLTPGVTEYTVEAPESGTYWFHAYTIAKVPVGKQHFADLRWDEDLPMIRRLLQANQTEKSMKLDRVTFEKGKPRRLYFSYDDQSVTVKRIRFTKLVPRRPPKAVVSYKVPFDPPARHPRVLVDPALVKKLKKNLEHPENLPAWEKIRKNALAPYSFAPSPDRELAFDKNVVAVLRESASQKMTGNMTLLTIDHGIAPQKAMYRYRMRRATDPVKPETWLKTSSSRIHALAAGNRILTAAFVPGEITLKNGKKCPVTPGIAILDAAGNVLQRSGFRVK